MTDPGELTDMELLSRAHHWRREALRGEPLARDRAHVHETEVRRRFAATTTLMAPMEPRHAARRPWWRFW